MSTWLILLQLYPNKPHTINFFIITIVMYWIKSGHFYLTSIHMLYNWKHIHKLSKFCNTSEHFRDWSKSKLFFINISCCTVVYYFRRHYNVWWFVLINYFRKLTTRDNAWFSVIHDWTLGTGTWLDIGQVSIYMYMYQQIGMFIKRKPRSVVYYVTHIHHNIQIYYGNILQKL